jgi:hypothetical protein
VLIFALCFYPAVLLFSSKPGANRSTILRCLLAGLSAFVLFLPWFIHIFNSLIFSKFINQVTTLPGQVEDFAWQYNSLGDLSIFLPKPIWLILALAGGWGLWQRKRPVAQVALWWFVLLLATNPQWLGLPGMGVISNFALFIAAYIPAGLIIGMVLGDLIELTQGISGKLKNPAWVPFAAAIVLLAAGALGARQRLWDVQIPSSALVTRPDIRAAGWIKANLAPDARFVINSFPAYGGIVFAGADAGWWLPLLAQRSTLLPPIMYGNEIGPTPNYVEEVNFLNGEIVPRGFDDPQVVETLLEHGAAYIYLGQQQGKVNNPGPALEPGILSASPYLEPLYHQDRVWIFHLKSP